MNKIIIMAVLFGFTGTAGAGPLGQLADRSGLVPAETSVQEAPAPMGDPADKDCNAAPGLAGCQGYCNSYPQPAECQSFCADHPTYPGCTRNAVIGFKADKANCQAYPAAPGCPAFCNHHHGFPGCSPHAKQTPAEKAVDAGYIDNEVTESIDEIYVDAKEARPLQAKLNAAGVKTGLKTEMHPDGHGGQYAANYLTFAKKVAYMRYVSKDYVGGDGEVDMDVLGKDMDAYIRELEGSGKGIAVNTDVFPSSDEEVMYAWEVWFVALK